MRGRGRVVDDGNYSNDDVVVMPDEVNEMVMMILMMCSDDDDVIVMVTIEAKANGISNWNWRRRNENGVSAKWQYEMAACSKRRRNNVVMKKYYIMKRNDSNSNVLCGNGDQCILSKPDIVVILA